MTTHLHPMQSFRMSGVIPLLSLHAFRACTETSLNAVTLICGAGTCGREPTQYFRLLIKTNSSLPFQVIKLPTLSEILTKAKCHKHKHIHYKTHFLYPHLKLIWFNLPAIRRTALSAGSSCKMLKGLSFAHSFKLPSKSNSIVNGNYSLKTISEFYQPLLNILFVSSHSLASTCVSAHHRNYTGKLVPTTTARSRRNGNVTHTKNNLSKNITYTYFHE